MMDQNLELHAFRHQKEDRRLKIIFYSSTLYKQSRLFSIKMWILDFLFFSALKQTAAENSTAKEPPIFFDGTQVRSKRGSCIDRQECVKKVIYYHIIKKNQDKFLEGLFI